jgi:hypothetical protein
MSVQKNSTRLVLGPTIPKGYVETWKTTILLKTGPVTPRDVTPSKWQVQHSQDHQYRNV